MIQEIVVITGAMFLTWGAAIGATLLTWAVLVILGLSIGEFLHWAKGS